MSGWKLPGYIVEDLLGFGATGDVWRGRVASSGEPVALKRITVGDAAQLRSAHTEAALLATLDHPHLVRLHELVPIGEGAVLVLDLATGGTLAGLIEARGRVTPGEAITALAPVGAALAYAHNAGVVHGDVTPANVLFTEAGMPLLADLGVARLLGDDAPVQCTPAFIDPAVARGCLPGPQSDVFMLGAVTLHSLTGRPLWPGDTPAQVLAAAAAGETGEIEAQLAAVDVPEAMRAVLARGLSVEPGRRGSAAEFALDLRHAGTPVVVELSAGRQPDAAALPTPAAPFRAQLPGTDNDQFEHPSPTSTDSARPRFDRPRGADAATPKPVLTHAVRPRPRPMPARRSRRGLHGHRAALGARRARWVAGAAAAVVLAIGSAWIVRDRARNAAPPTAAPAVRVAGAGARPPTIPTQRPSPTTAATASRVGTGPDLPDASGVATALKRLDTLRQQAFADRNAGLLANVYAAGPLLRQDTALLTRLVPAGCRLVGVHTDYGQVRVIGATASRVQASVRATLSDSVLVCGGTTTGRALGSGPSMLRIVLAPHGAGYLITGIHR
jgi:eukaryotic-like serine/threonine-protein kinase